MLDQLKHRWSAFKRLEPGQRFQIAYRRHRESKTGKSPAYRILYVLLGVVALGIGVVLVFIPGPAIVFFFLAGAIFAMQSLWIARALDWTELRARALAKAVRTRLRRHRAALHSHR
jgi:putative transmembrane protein PGPGW